MTSSVERKPRAVRNEPIQGLHYFRFLAQDLRGHQLAEHGCIPSTHRLWAYTANLGHKLASDSDPRVLRRCAQTEQ